MSLSIVSKLKKSLWLLKLRIVPNTRDKLSRNSCYSLAIINTEFLLFLPLPKQRHHTQNTSPLKDFESTFFFLSSYARCGNCNRHFCHWISLFFRTETNDGIVYESYARIYSFSRIKKKAFHLKAYTTSKKINFTLIKATHDAHS